MSQYQHQILRAPAGMAPSADPGSIPENRARRMKGVFPARLGVNKPFPVPVVIFEGPKTDDNQIAALFRFGYSGSYSIGAETMLLLRSDDVYWGTFGPKMHLVGGEPVVTITTSFSDIGNFSIYFFPHVRETQFGRHLYLASTSGTPRDRGRAVFVTDNVFFYTWGITTPSAPTLTDAAGALTGTYQYKITYVDNDGLESSPSAAASRTVTSKKITVDRNTSPSSTLGVVSWNIYRKNPGGTAFWKVTTVAIATATYEDNNADSAITGNAQAPEPGQNDPPPANIIASCAWKNRMVVASSDTPYTINMSNEDGPTQFSTLTDFTDPNLGASFQVVRNGRSEVTGLGVNGSVLTIFTEDSIHEMYGDNLYNFTLRQVSQGIGCVSHDSIQNAGGALFFLSDRGPYAVYPGGLPTPFADEMNSSFRGFFALKQIEVGGDAYPNAVRTAMRYARACIYKDLYILGIGDNTYAYDVVAGGWTDLGIGYVGNISRFNSYDDLLPLGIGTGLQGDSSYLIWTGGRDFNATVMPKGPIGSTTTTGLYQVYAVSDEMEVVPYRATSFPRYAEADPVPIEIAYRPFDGQGTARSRVKRAKRLTIFGKYLGNLKEGETIGTVTLESDSGYSEQYNVLVPDSRMAEEGKLVEQEFTLQMKGRLLMPSISLPGGMTELNDQMLEYIPVN